MGKNLSSPAYGNTVGTAVTLAIGGNGCKMAYCSHSAGRTHGVPPLCTPPPPMSNEQFGPKSMRSERECSLDTPFGARDNIVKRR